MYILYEALYGGFIYLRWMLVYRFFLIKFVEPNGVNWKQLSYYWILIKRFLEYVPYDTKRSVEDINDHTARQIIYTWQTIHNISTTYYYKRIKFAFKGRIIARKYIVKIWVLTKYYENQVLIYTLKYIIAIIS